MKKINIISLLSILLFLVSCGSNVCEETIKKLSLTEKGFCDICIGETVETVANKIGDVDPANYRGTFIDNNAILSEFREFNGVMAEISANYSDNTLTIERNGNVYWLNGSGVSTLLLTIPCFQEGLLGRRIYLYDAICKYYRKKYSPVVEEQDRVSTFFKIKASQKSYLPPYCVVIVENKDNDMVQIFISNIEDIYSEWKMGMLM